MRLYSTLGELESRRDTLREEERNRLSPAEERDRLLARVRQDNGEIAAMERASAELREHIRQSQLNLHQLNEVLFIGIFEILLKIFGPNMYFSPLKTFRSTIGFCKNVVTF